MELFSKSHLPKLATCLSSSFFLMMTGYSIVNFHMKSLLLRGGATSHPDLCTVVAGLVQVLSNMVSAALVDRLGRRLLLAVSGGAIALVQAGLAVVFYLQVHILENIF